jgi:hypothetical protein
MRLSEKSVNRFPRLSWLVSAWLTGVLPFVSTRLAVTVIVLVDA